MRVNPPVSSVSTNPVEPTTDTTSDGDQVIETTLDGVNPINGTTPTVATGNSPGSTTTTALDTTTKLQPAEDGLGKTAMVGGAFRWRH